MKTKITFAISNLIGMMTLLLFLNANAQTVYTQNFSGGIPGTWQSVDNTGGTGGSWAYTTTGPARWTNYLSGTGPKFTTASNGYVMFDSDGKLSDGNPEDATLTVESINCSSLSTVILNFEQHFGQYGNSTTIVQVSNDGGTSFTDFDLNTSYTQDQFTPNPDIVKLDITSVAGGQSNVIIRFHWVGDYDYWWCIDDIRVYQPFAQDAGVEAFLGPNTSGCTLGIAESVYIRIRNYGLTPISNFDVTYTLDGNPSSPETITSTIAADATFDYTFLATANLSSIGTHTLSATTNLSGDGDNTNDALTGYNAYSLSPYDVSSGPLTMGFETADNFVQNGWTILDNNGDGITWDLTSNRAHSGSVSIQSNYSATLDADDWFFSPCMNLQASKQYAVSFYYRVRSGTYPENLTVNLMSDANPSQQVTTLIDFQDINNNTYVVAQAKFSPPSDGDYNIGFYTWSVANMWQIIIDDIKVYEVPPYDAGITEIFSPQTGSCSLSNAEQINVAVTNFGSNPISNFDVSYRVNGGSLVTETISSTIDVDSTLDFTFSTTQNLSPKGDYNIEVYSSLPSDAGSWNDTMKTSVTSIVNDLSSIFKMGFDSSVEFLGWNYDDGTTETDANDDQNTWGWFAGSLAQSPTGFLMYDSSQSVDADDWFYSPCLTLVTGKTYTLKYSYRTDTAGGSANFTQDFKVHLGSDQNVAAMNGGQMISDQPGVYSNPGWMNVSSNFTVSTNGTYYLGWHVTTLLGQSYLLIDDVSVEAASSINTPSSIDELISIYPNPSTGKFIISNNLKKENNIRIEVTNVLGQTIREYNFGKTSSGSFDLSNQPDGIYFVKIKSDGGMITKKITLSR